MTVRRLSGFLVILASGLAAALVSSAYAITLGQLDDFENGGLGDWDGAFNNVTSNVADAGPAGAGDNALDIQPGSRFVFYNQMQWAGDYIAAGVNRLSLDIQHANEFDLELRIGISKGAFGSLGAGDTYITTYSVIVPNDGQWRHVEFDMEPTDFVPSLGNTMPGPGGAAGALAGVTQLRILHRPIDGGPDDFEFTGVFQPGAVRIDNILAEAASPPVNSDFDGDEDVDGNDFLIWQRGLGAGTHLTGDANDDGAVDGVDLDLWEADFGAGAAASAAAAIPEPAAIRLALASLGLLALALRPRG